MNQISICIPTYNGARYFEECLQSIINQKGNITEIIISDDCSNDNTLEIARAFQKHDSRIKIYKNEHNLGLTGNWNRCLDIATGEWIKFVFQDDILNDNCIAEMVKHISEKVEIIACDREFIFEEDIDKITRHTYLHEVLKMHRMLSISKPTFFNAQEISNIAVKFITSNFIGEPTSVMFRRNMIGRVGKFNNDLIQICDFEYWLRIASQYGLVFIPESLNKFRVHKSATSHHNVKNKYNQAIYLDKIVFTYQLLFSPLYANFRKNLSKYQLWKIKYYLQAKLAGSRCILPDTDSNVSFIKELNVICNKYAIDYNALKLSFMQNIILQLLLPVRIILTKFVKS